MYFDTTNTTDIIHQQLSAKLGEIQEMLKSIKHISKISSKEKLRVVSRKSNFQYYIIKEEGDTNGTYLPRKEIKKAAAIAQRDYNNAASAILKKQIKAIDTFLDGYHPNVIDDVYTKLHPGRRTLVTPVREPDEEFITAWQHHPYTGKPFEINAPEYYTSTGVRVRSKSEVIIADALSRANIPYRYEYPTSIKGWGTLYPDFTCLDIQTREEIIWEHFGLMDDPDYTSNTIQKIAHYITSDYILGKNFIATFESKSVPFSVKQVLGYIKAIFNKDISRKQN